MAYDYPDRVTDQWDFASQAAIWRERALHQAQRAEHFKAIAEALRNGTTLTKETK